MKASESNANYASKVRECTNFAAKQVKKVCTDIGPRPSGEDGEKRAQDYLVDLMTPIADEVTREKFTLHPKAFMGWVLIDGSFMLVSAVLMILAILNTVPAATLGFKIAATVLSVLSLFFLLGEFLFYKELLDPFFPKRESSNVMCSMKPTGEIKRRIIMAGHMDSAYEWRYTHLGGGKLLTAVIATGIASLVVSLVIDILSFFDLGNVMNIIMIVLQCLTIPGFVLVLFFVNWGLCVPGANDNLTGVFGAMAVAKYMKDNDVHFENTEVIAMASGCEEAGLRGAKAYAKAHAAEYAKEAEEKGVETVFMAVDTLRDYDFMGVYNSDMTGTVKLDKQAAKMLKKACENAGYDIPYASVFFGSSDAAAGQQGGLRSVALAAMDPAPARYYHTRRDTADNLDMKTFEAGIKIMLEAVYLFDEKGLQDNYD